MRKPATIMIAMFMILLVNTSFSQVNLVPNPSFEESHGEWPCPFNNLDSIPWPNYWVSPASVGDGDPDYLISWCCNQYSSVPSNYAGIQFPYEGDAYTMIGLVSDTAAGHAPYREYLQTVLLDTLRSGHRYCFSAWMSSSDSAAKVTDDIGVYFSDTAIYKYDGKNFPVTPQIRNPEGRYLDDKANWQLFSGSFVAVGGERYITIGNFLDDFHTNYITPQPHSNDVGWTSVGAYYLDMVSLYDCTGFDYRANAGGKNLHISLGDSVQLGTDASPARQYSWSPAAALNSNTIGTPTAAPQQTTTYTLTVIDEYFQMTSDSITVFVDPVASVAEKQNERNIKVYPNPAADIVTIEFKNGIFENAIVELYDLTGQKVLVETIESGSSKHQINLKEMNAGFYYCKVINNGLMYGEQKIVIVK
ncbi:MAG: T9SS type A sorting domain-containing protein [Bacteroidota bacterium]